MRKSKVWFLVLAIFCASVLGANKAFADGSPSTNGWHNKGDCSQSNRVSHGDSTCLSASWNNSPGFWSGYPGGSSYSVSSSCYSWGKVIAHLDYKNRADYHVHLPNYGSYGSKHSTAKIRNISCCMNTSALCYKKEVEAVNGKIYRWTGTGTTMVEHDVSTRIKRYEHCQAFPWSIYCAVNPSGDALTRVEYNCGDHYCNVGDCKWHYMQSPASKKDGYLYNCALVEPALQMSIDANDGTSQKCTISVSCNTKRVERGRGYVWKDNTLTAQVWDIVKLRNCGGTLTMGSCP